jgi:Domain of unknown function (DUF4956)
MPEWFPVSLSNGSSVPLVLLVWRIAGATVLGSVVAGLYRWARRGEVVQPTFLATLVLLATVIAMATQVIGDNVARAFSLVGALSVVRFRTVVKDTQDTAFVILAVVVGMSAGANNAIVGLVGLCVVGVTALALWPPGRTDGGWRRVGSTVSLRIGLADSIRASVEALLRESTDGFDLVSAATARQGSSFDLVYRVRLRADHSPAQIVADLNVLEGVESVDLRRGE